MYVIIWQYEVAPEAREAFERAYGSDGDWAALFRMSRDYLGTQLARDIARPERYLTLDYWRSEAAFVEFKAARHAEYDALDQQCASLTSAEERIGAFYRAGD
jgi:heme-degrading monooxygenase HmoA